MNQDNQQSTNSTNSKSSSSSGFLSIASSSSFFDFHDAMQDYYNDDDDEEGAGGGAPTTTDLEAARGNNRGTNEPDHHAARRVCFNEQVAVYDIGGDLQYYRFGNSFGYDDDDPHDERGRIFNEANMVHSSPYIGMGSYWDLNDFSNCSNSPPPDGEDTSVSLSNDDSFQLDDLLARSVIPGDLEEQRLPQDFESHTVRSMCRNDPESDSSISSLGPKRLFPKDSDCEKQKNGDDDDSDDQNQRRGEPPPGLWMTGLCCLGAVGPKLYSFLSGGEGRNVVDEGDVAGGFVPTGGEGVGGASGAGASGAGGGGGGVGGGGSSAVPVLR